MNIKPRPSMGGSDDTSTGNGGRSMPTIISDDLQLEGALVSKGEVQMNGALKGDVQARSIVISETGKVHGKVTAQTVMVQGEVVGSIRASVEGDVTYTVLSIEERARLEGEVRYAESPFEGQSDLIESTKTPASPTPSAPDKSASDDAKGE